MTSREVVRDYQVRADGLESSFAVGGWMRVVAYALDKMHPPPGNLQLWERGLLEKMRERVP